MMHTSEHTEWLYFVCIPGDGNRYAVPTKWENGVLRIFRNNDGNGCLCDEDIPHIQFDTENEARSFGQMLMDEHYGLPHGRFYVCRWCVDRSTAKPTFYKDAVCVCNQ